MGNLLPQSFGQRPAVRKALPMAVEEEEKVPPEPKQEQLPNFCQKKNMYFW